MTDIEAPPIEWEPPEVLEQQAPTPRTNGTRPSPTRHIPHDLDAEAALLGALLNTTGTDTLNTITAGHFYKPNHAHIYDAITAVNTAGHPIEPVAVANELRHRGHLDTIGGPHTLLQLQADCPSTSNTATYTRILTDTHRARALIALGHDLTDAGYTENTAAAPALLQRAHQLTVDTTAAPLYADMAAALAAPATPPPTILTRTDGNALFYAAKTNGLNGEPGHGKGWIAVFAAVDVLAQGGTVAWIDYEDEAHTLAERLLAAGATPDLIAEGLLYPANPPTTATEAAALAHDLTQRHTELVVIDSAGESIAAYGLDEDRSGDVRTWHEQLPRAICNATAAAVIIIDHLAKDKEKRGRWSRGSGKKVEAITGVMYGLEVDVAVNRDRPSNLRLTVVKDRPGHVGPPGAHATTITTRPTNGGLTYKVAAPPTQASTGFRPTVLMERISVDVEQLNDAGIEPTANQLCTSIRGNKSAKLEAIRILVAEGYLAITKGPNRSVAHRHLQPYLQVEDPHSDAYQQAHPETDDDQAEVDF